MKGIFVSYNQAYNEEIVELLESFGQRGFTRWEDVEGRGSFEGEPHMGNHAWPTMNHALITFVPVDKAPAIMQALREKDGSNQALGLRAYCWTIEMFY